MPHLDEDTNWEAEQDARTLAEAKLISADSGRLASAEQAATKLAEEKKEEAAAMNSVASDKLRQRFDHPTSAKLFRNQA